MKSNVFIKNKFKALIIFSLLFSGLNHNQVLADPIEDGIAEFESKNYYKAIEFFKKAVQNNPDDIVSHKWLINCYTELVDMDNLNKEKRILLKLQNKERVKEAENNIVEETTKVETNNVQNAPVTVVIINNKNESKAGSRKYTGNKKPKIGIVDFELVDRPYYNSSRLAISKLISDYLESELLKSGVSIIEREKVSKVIEEINLSRSKLINSDQSRAVGKLHGLDFIIIGRLIDLNINTRRETSRSGKSVTVKKEGTLRTSAKLIHVETGEEIWSDVNVEKLSDTSSEMGIITDADLEDRMIKASIIKMSDSCIKSLNDYNLK